jgi:hypothetical protein
MSNSRLEVWAIVRQLPDMQNAVVNRFRRRSDAEACLRLLSRSMPNRNYVILYAPPGLDLGALMEAIPQDWAMSNADGNAAVAKMMRQVQKALSRQPLPKVRALLKTKLAEIADAYPEIYDTEVQSIIIIRLTNWACQVHELPVPSALPTDYWNLSPIHRTSDI